jgi:hypothetical protein
MLHPIGVDAIFDALRVVFACYFTHDYNFLRYRAKIG